METGKVFRKRNFWRNLYKVLSIVGIFSGFFFSSCALQRCVVFPRCSINETPFREDRHPGLRQVWISTPQGKVEAWFVPAKTHASDKGTGRKPAVIFAHGNAELIDHADEIVRGYTSLGVHVMLCEYRGYGRSAGTPSEKRIVADFVKCRDRLAGLGEVDPERIFYHGRSLGTGVVCGLARKRNPAALILQSPFVSVAALMAKYLIPRIFVLDPFDNLGALRNFKGPVLLLHGIRDRVIPFSHSERLNRAAAQSTLKEYSWGHNDFYYGPQYWQDIESFLREKGIL